MDLFPLQVTEVSDAVYHAIGAAGNLGGMARWYVDHPEDRDDRVGVNSIASCFQALGRNLSVANESRLWIGRNFADLHEDRPEKSSSWHQEAFKQAWRVYFGILQAVSDTLAMEREMQIVAGYSDTTRHADLDFVYRHEQQIIAYLARKVPAFDTEVLQARLQEEAAALIAKREALVAAAGPAPDEIVYLGGQSYRIGNSKPVVVTDSEHFLLTAFLECPSRSMDSTQLKDQAGWERAPRDLRELRDKYDGVFRPAIHCPKTRGRGGYRVSIRNLNSDSAEAE